VGDLPNIKKNKGQVTGLINNIPTVQVLLIEMIFTAEKEHAV
jgi:hypothetical protein